MYCLLSILKRALKLCHTVFTLHAFHLRLDLSYRRHLCEIEKRCMKFSDNNSVGYYCLGCYRNNSDCNAQVSTFWPDYKALLPRSASYRASTGDCQLSDMDRHTVAGTGAFQESLGEEYLENNCADDPVKLCDFQLLENRIMKTVDSVYQVGFQIKFPH